LTISAFQIVLGVLTGLALTCFVLRLSIRLIYQKALRLDDAFLILSVACLCAATGILYHICYFLYLHAATLFIPRLLPYLLTEFADLLLMQERVYPYLALIWTTTFGVKACFLAFMRPLVWHVSRAMNWYFWFIVGFTAVTWAFVVSEPFIICPYFGLEAGMSILYLMCAGSKTRLTAFCARSQVLLIDCSSAKDTRSYGISYYT
jgi:hypothetical protein